MKLFDIKYIFILINFKPLFSVLRYFQTLFYYTFFMNNSNTTLIYGYHKILDYIIN